MNIDQLKESSGYFHSIIKRHPAIMESLKEYEQVSTDGYIDLLKFRYEFAQKITDYDESFKVIRQIKNIESAIIGARDFFFNYKVTETVGYISILAEFCIDLAVEAAISKLNQTEEIKITRHFIEENIIIIGMGKFGGRELNFSSDIDLIFFCSNESVNEYSKHQLINKFFRVFLDTLRKSSPDGFVYRVDMRLRPEGVSGPLFMTLEQAVNYYASRAKNWEFQALIKAGLVFGSKKIYAKFREAVDPMIFRHQSPEKVLEEIKTIKDKIETAIATKNSPADIKLSPGGIRDVEFIIQFLQLIHGVRYIEIRDPNSIKALKSLRTFNIVDKEKYQILKENYKYLRKIENILQFNDNLPIHELPSDYDSIVRIFKGWKYNENELLKNNDPVLFLDTVQKRMKSVRAIFTELFEETLNYLNLKNIIENKYTTANKIYLNDHFNRMDSEYFLRFSSEEIARHIEMIQNVNKDNLCEIMPVKIKKNLWSLRIVAYDYSYEFSKIAGLLSSYYLDIIEGESFTYCDYSSIENLDTTIRLKEHHSKQIYFGVKPEDNTAIRRRKIVCVMKVKLADKEFIQNLAGIDWNAFKKDLLSILRFLEDQSYDKAEEYLNNMIFSTMKGLKDATVPSIYPVEITVDNHSSEQYTILHIRSKDSFAFLYTFTNVLAMRNYYIFKIEITTVKNMAVDRLFIMTKSGSKINDQRKVEELKIAVMMIKQYSAMLIKAVNPSKALHYFDELLSRVLESSDKHELPIIGQKDVLDKLAQIFGISDFIWEDLFRMNYQTLLPILEDNNRSVYISKKELYNLFETEYPDYNQIKLTDFAEKLNQFKDKHLFRIDLRQLLKKTDVFGFGMELTELAEFVLELTIKKVIDELADNRGKNPDAAWALYGLGKLGGCELGYASDIEIMFIFESNDQENATDDQFFFETVIQTLLKSFKTKREGIFEIDLNLRPYGSKGRLAVTLGSFIEYFSAKGHARFFERQALTRFRFITGSTDCRDLIEKAVKHRDTFVYGTPVGELEELYNVRKLQLQTYATDSGIINMKYSSGGLVEIEYLAQVLAMEKGAGYQDIRLPSTIKVLNGLKDNGIIQAGNYDILYSAFVFYINFINILRMVKGNSRDLTFDRNNEMDVNYLVKRAKFIGMIENESEEELFSLCDFYRKKVNILFNSLREMIK